MEHLMVYPIGTYVQFVNPENELENEDSDLPYGVICGILLKESGVQYEVAWWEVGSRCCEWLSELEFRTAENTEKKRVGFHGTIL